MGAIYGRIAVENTSPLRFALWMSGNIDFWKEKKKSDGPAMFLHTVSRW